MILNLQSDLPHQQIPLEIINYVFKDVRLTHATDIIQNPGINFSQEYEKIKKNISDIQDGIFPANSRPLSNELKKQEFNGENLILDIKMETGTGKTYVYTRMMYELHKNYGYNKFIILVPSVAIKEGAKHFLSAEYMKRHFEDLYRGTKLNLSVLSPIKSNSKKGRRSVFPQSVRNFVNATSLDRNTINVLLTNQGMFLDNEKSSMNKEYDQVLLDGHSQPYAALRDVNPVLIIDEPHKFKRDNKTFKNVILGKINPQLIIRYGATFPERKVKKTGLQKDYANLLYNLTSCVAFNKNLVKGVDVEYVGESGADEKYKLVDITGPSKNKIAKFRNEKTKKIIELHVGSSLSQLNNTFSGITIYEIGSDPDSSQRCVFLSNDKKIRVDETLLSGVYSASYQEKMIEHALNCHFKVEQENFDRKIPIKSLTLFFIDSIKSYRSPTNSDGYLKVTFEKLLKKKLIEVCTNVEKEIKEGKNLREYYNYLKASLNNISETHGGYFAADNDSSDTAIQKEVDEILRDKEKLLSYKAADGSYYLRRFIFSKWTLKEGWDNPNVFTIAKLRSSGSEDSKIQEVGRGLRLPVDVFGNRISDEEFRLNYIVDYSEKNFASKLVSEINNDTNIPKDLTELLVSYSTSHNIPYNTLIVDLLTNSFIEYTNDGKKIIINDNKQEECVAKYPTLFESLKSGKIRNKNNHESPTVAHIRKDKFKELERIWNELNKRYYISISDLSDDFLIDGFINILNELKPEKSKIIAQSVSIHGSKDGEYVECSPGKTIAYDIDDIIPYNKYLQALEHETSIPILLLHKAYVGYSKKTPLSPEYFSTNTLQSTIMSFYHWRHSNFFGHYKYEKLNTQVSDTKLTKNGIVKDSVLASDIGVQIIQNPKPIDKYLYDLIAFDSPLEKENIMRDVDNVTVFGKIPKNSIRIPLFWKGEGDNTYSPDFIYCIKMNSGENILNIIVETKDVKADVNLRELEKYKIQCAEKFVEALSNNGINVKFGKQLRTDDITTLLQSIIESPINTK